MTIENTQTKLFQDEALEAEALANQESVELSDTSASDGYDPHIVPAETAARKDREGNNFKQLPDQPDDSDMVNTAGGFTVDKEGLVDNFAIEPEMYYETPGDAE